MRKIQRLMAAVLAAALAVSMAVLPASAAPGSFEDVSDQTTALNADILRLMGIVSGVGGNRFDPEGALTRAQFCTMAVNFLQKRDEAARYATRTIFSDVGSAHWARSYINYAASCSIGGGTGEDASGSPLVAGIGDGRFLPDENITLAEAATILLRALGYSGQQAGAVWPKGYMDLAASIGLLNGLPGEAAAVISRAHAAQLFVNALRCTTSGGEAYYKSLGTKIEKAIIVEVNALTDDSTSHGALRTVIGPAVRSYLPAQGDGGPVALLGRRGELVLNARDEIVTFLPDNSTRITAVLEDDARSGSFKGGAGRQYTVAEDTPVYVADDTEDSGYQDCQDYSKAFDSLVSGTQVTMYAENGKIVTIFASIPGVNISADAVVVMGTPSAAIFYQLTGGRTDFTLRRGEEAIALGDLTDYDVVTYDKAANTLLVSDLRLSCVYTEASPSPADVEKVTVKVGDSEGNEFEVLESAWHTTNSFKPGDSVVLLLTADGRVAGMAAPSRTLRSTAVVFVDGGKTPTMFLPNGKTRELKGTVSTDNMENRLAILSGNKSSWTASQLTGTKAPGDYQVSAADLGGLPVASNVRIYEQAGSGAMVPIDRKELTSGSISAAKIAGYRQNSSGIVDFIVLEDVTGNAYEYGMMVSTTRTEKNREDSNKNPLPDKVTTVWDLRRSTGTLDFVESVSYTGKAGDMVGAAVAAPKGNSSSRSYTLPAVIHLTEVKDVKPSDFFISQDMQYVAAGGRTYLVASDVECCRGNGGKRAVDVVWLIQNTGAERLAAVKAYSDNLTLYVDPIGQQVRVIRAD